MQIARIARKYGTKTSVLRKLIASGAVKANARVNSINERSLLAYLRERGEDRKSDIGIYERMIRDEKKKLFARKRPEKSQLVILNKIKKMQSELNKLKKISQNIKKEIKKGE